MFHLNCLKKQNIILLLSQTRLYLVSSTSSLSCFYYLLHFIRSFRFHIHSDPFFSAPLLNFAFQCSFQQANLFNPPVPSPYRIILLNVSIPKQLCLLSSNFTINQYCLLAMQGSDQSNTFNNEGTNLT